VENGQFAPQRKFVSDSTAVASTATAGSPEYGHSIEVAVGALNRWGVRIPPVRAAELRAKVVNRGQLAGSGDLENHTEADSAAP
jgi:hypothetical protein